MAVEQRQIAAIAGELHGPAPVVADARQIYRAAAAARQRTQCRGVDFQSNGDITDRMGRAAAQPARAIDVTGDGLCGRGALCGAQCAAA